MSLAAQCADVRGTSSIKLKFEDAYQSGITQSSMITSIPSALPPIIKSRFSREDGAVICQKCNPCRFDSNLYGNNTVYQNVVKFLSKR